MNKKKHIRIIFFDLFGTLVPKRHIKKNILFKLLNLNSSEIELAYKIASKNNFNSLSEYIKYLEKEFKRNFFLVKILIPIFNLILKYRIKKTNYYKDVLEEIKFLKKKGYKIGLISNISSFQKDIILKNKIKEYFDYLVLSYEIGFMKPEKEIYLELLKLTRSKNKKDILIVGDNYYNDYLIPKELGFNSLLIERKRDKNINKNIKYIKNLKELNNYLN